MDENTPAGETPDVDPMMQRSSTPAQPVETPAEPVPEEVKEVAGPSDEDMPMATASAPIPTVVDGNDKKKKSPKFKMPKIRMPKLPVLISLLVALLLGGTSYAYFVYLPNTPQNVWRHGLAAVGVGLEDISSNEKLFEYENASFEGGLDVAAPFVFDATFDGVLNTGGDGKFNLNLDFNNIQPSLKTIWKITEGSEVAYINVSQLEELMDNFLPGTFKEIFAKTKVENIWWKLNSEELLGAPLTDIVPSVESPTAELTSDFVSALNTYMFTSNTDNMVFEIDEVLEKELYEGVMSQKYSVKLNEANLQKLVEELETSTGASVDESNALGIDLEDVLDGLVTSLESEEVKVEAWVSTGPKILRNVRISFNDDGSYVDFSLLVDSTDYTILPVRLFINGSETEPGNLAVLLKVNLETFSTGVEIDGILGSEDSPDLRAKGSLTITPSETPVEVTAPEKSQNIETLIEKVLGGGFNF